MPGVVETVAAWKLLEYVAKKAVSPLARLLLARHAGRAQIDVDREAALVKAQTERDCEAIKAGLITYSPATLSFPALTASVKEAENQAEVINAIASAQVEQALRRERNVALAVLHAVNEASSHSPDEEPSANPDIDDDWLSRWRDSASQVSSEQMQALWGRVLAGEFKKPGSYSLRTMEFLRGLSHNEAQTINALAPYVFSDRLFLREHLKNGPAPLQDLIELQQAGFLAGVDGLGLNFSFDISTKAGIIACRDHFFRVVSTESKTINMPTVILTTRKRLPVNLRCMMLLPCAFRRLLVIVLFTLLRYVISARRRSTVVRLHFRKRSCCIDALMRTWV